MFAESRLRLPSLGNEHGENKGDQELSPKKFQDERIVSTDSTEFRTLFAFP